MKLLDTTFIVDCLRGDKSANFKSYILDQESVIYTTEVNVFEIMEGIFQNHSQAKRLADFERFLNQIQVLPFDRKSAIKSGEISAKLYEKGKPVEDTDVLIAGIALSNGIKTIVTKNKKHFQNIKGLKVETY